MTFRSDNMDYSGNAYSFGPLPPLLYGYRPQGQFRSVRRIGAVGHDRPLGLLLLCRATCRNRPTKQSFQDEHFVQSRRGGLTSFQRLRNPRSDWAASSIRRIDQTDQDGKTGSRTASKMRFRLNLANINVGMTVHLWNKKERVTMKRLIAFRRTVRFRRSSPAASITTCPTPW